jgi:hypothetical protein
MTVEERIKAAKDHSRKFPFLAGKWANRLERPALLRDEAEHAEMHAACLAYPERARNWLYDLYGILDGSVTPESVKGKVY